MRSRFIYENCFYNLTEICNKSYLVKSTSWNVVGSWVRANLLTPRVCHTSLPFGRAVGIDAGSPLLLPGRELVTWPQQHVDHTIKLLRTTKCGPGRCWTSPASRAHLASACQQQASEDPLCLRPYELRAARLIREEPRRGEVARTSTGVISCAGGIDTKRTHQWLCPPARSSPHYAAL
jgi:hypothetical protein